MKNSRITHQAIQCKVRGYKKAKMAKKKLDEHHPPKPEGHEPYLKTVCNPSK